MGGHVDAMDHVRGCWMLLPSSACTVSFIVKAEGQAVSPFACKFEPVLSCRCVHGNVEPSPHVDLSANSIYYLS